MDEETYMARCIEVARMGEGNTEPNPMVGSVIVYKDQIIGEGYHHIYGEAHAEVNAIESVADKSLLPKATLFVNLEPCSHYGKTPPCSDRIIREGIKKVVIGTEDPNSLVAGEGIKKMRSAGIQIKTGILADECYYLNRAFFTYHNNKRPYVILKWAQTTDGYMDIKRQAGESPHVNWITGKSLKTLVHRWRAHNAAILVGTVTAFNDDPQLNVREWKGNNPLRLVLDENNILPENLKLFNQEIPTLVFCRHAKTNKANLKYVELDFNKPIIPQILDYLYELNLQTLMVEGGKLLLDSFIDVGLWDEIRVLSGDRFFYEGLKAPKIPKHAKTIDHVGKDRFIHVINENNPFLKLKN
ncbi:MAG: bifunctional diaminohydroxyphosphoribosylaminopyrimidine deaminase/5-amino-6-(5-phosphoribosylamino)uracil reductase RibD [Bacteroidales bacterium]